jgi:adenosylhomocysteine nucleosidase
LKPSAAPRTDAAATTVIVAAMNEELEPLLGRVRTERRSDIDGCSVVRGTLGRVQVVVARTGEGSVAAARGAAAVLGEVYAERLLVVGVSGGLSESLEPGALVVGRSVIRIGGTSQAPDEDWLAAATKVGDACSADLLTASEILCTPSAKSEALAGLNVEGPVAVDLETASYAEVAESRNVPWLAVRAISDGAREELPLDFNRFRDEEGRIDRAKVMFYTMRHPAIVPAMLGMQRRVSHCAERLAEFAEKLLNPSSEVD